MSNDTICDKVKQSMLYGYGEDRYYTTKGAGRPSLLPIWQVSDLQDEILTAKSAMFFPYSATPPFLPGNQKIPLSDGALEVMRRSLGNLWSLPWDHRLHFTFQRVDLLSSMFYHGRASSSEPDAQAGYITGHYDQLAALELVGGSFVIYDIDDYGSKALYSLSCKYTAADAEEVSLRIEPSLFSISPGPNFSFKQPPFTAPWRRLM